MMLHFYNMSIDSDHEIIQIQGSARKFKKVLRNRKISKNSEFSKICEFYAFLLKNGPDPGFPEMGTFCQNPPKSPKTALSGAPKRAGFRGKRLIRRFLPLKKAISKQGRNSVSKRP